MIWSIFIPSRGRPDTKLPKLLEGLPVTLVVEPHEAGAYRAAQGVGDDVVALPESNRGLPYSRQWILDHARRSGLKWFWMMDDDVSKFHKVEGGRCPQASAREVLLAAQSLAAIPKLGQVALEYQQFAWRASKPFALDSYCDVCVGINASVPADYRPLGKEDRDFTMQVISAGWRTARDCKGAFSCPTNGTNKGGLYDEYKAGKERAWVKELVDLWPWCCEEQVKPSGRVDAKIHWKKIRRKS